MQFFFHQIILLTFLQTKTNNEKIAILKKQLTKHTYIVICNIHSGRDYKKYRYVSLFQIL